MSVLRKAPSTTTVTDRLDEFVLTIHLLIDTAIRSTHRVGT